MRHGSAGQRLPYLVVLAALAVACTCNGDPGGGDPPDGCEPTSCWEAGKNCGVVDDGCGGTIHCGYCGGGMVCGTATVANLCSGGDCRPVTCSRIGAECGYPADGCGGNLGCGFCGATTMCGGGGQPFTCGVSACTPATCESLGATCGRIPDGCGGVLDCRGPGAGDGGCDADETCGGGGAPNTCGTGTCTPSSCSADSCNYASDGCSDVLVCGTCDGGLACIASQCHDVADSIGEPCTGDADCETGSCLSEWSTGWPEGYCSISCTSDGDCGTGNVCGLVDDTGTGVCVRTCTTSDDCRGAGYVCGDVGSETGACVPGGTGTGSPGDPCQTVADCAGGTRGVCLGASEGLPGGYCTLTCETNAECPGDSECAFGTGGNGVCVAPCELDDDCRDGHLCQELPGDATGCWPGGGTGTACTEHSDCSGGICLTQSDTGWHGGYCTGTCTTSSDCGDGEVCTDGGPSGESICMQGCADGRDCRHGYACLGTDGGEAVCAPYGGGDTPPGGPCESVADCEGGAGATCVQGPDGGTCALACSDDADCESGARCTTTTSGSSVCRTVCTGPDDCPPGTECEPYDASGSVCQPAEPDPPGESPGGPCETALDCEDGLCITEELTGWSDGYCMSLCASDADCDAGSHCAQVFDLSSFGEEVYTCVASCTGSAECRDGYGCYDLDGDGRTECLPFGSGEGLGDPCTTIDECPGGEHAICNLDDWGFPDGYCSADCSSAACPEDGHCTVFPDESLCFDPVCCNQPATCDTTGWEEEGWVDPCGVGSACEVSTFSDAYGHCVLPDRTCSASLLCPQGYFCSNDTNGRCIRCDGDQYCREQYVCFDANGDGTRTCWPAATGTGSPGAPCTQLADCSGGAYGHCLTDERDGYPGGYCTWRCGGNVTCPSGSACINFFLATPDGQVLMDDDLCMRTCSTHGECRAGYECRVVEDGRPSVCVPQDEDDGFDD